MAYKIDFRLAKYINKIIGVKQRRENARVIIINATDRKF